MASKWEKAFFWPIALAIGVGIWVQIQKEVISDLKRENQFLQKEIWDMIDDLERERCVNRVLKLRIALWSPYNDFD